MTLSIDASNLTGWLTGQRWFGSKARELSAVNLLEVLPLREGDQPLILALVEARFQTGTHELYQLILGGRRGGEGPRRASSSPRRAAGSSSTRWRTR
jgi:hypothetical protein